MLKQLHLRHVGPADSFHLDLGDRVNLFTGDNGLGKTFLLDVAWWALTGTWAGEPAWPDQPVTGRPTISYRLATRANAVGAEKKTQFNFQRRAWQVPKSRKPTPCLVVYARVDGSFSVWDPVRNDPADKGGMSIPMSVPTAFRPPAPAAYHFAPSNVWNGLEIDGRVVCNGLIRDWVTWQTQLGRRHGSPFRVLTGVLSVLSPHQGELIRPGKARRVSIDDARQIPTIELPYGTIPVIYASAGMKRVLALAYFLTWAWYEHTEACRLAQRTPEQRLVVLVDEVEAHLHPQWQRAIVPALLRVTDEFPKRFRTQILATTHSPLVLASLEPSFSEKLDRLFSFELIGRSVTLEQVPWAMQGDVVGWLTSEAFGLRQARSREAELAIEAAEAWMRGADMSVYPDTLHSEQGIHQELLRVLAQHDPFWPRWIVTRDNRQP